MAYADLVASAAHLLCGEADEGLPAVILRGLDLDAPHGSAADLHRAAEHDLVSLSRTMNATELLEFMRSRRSLRRYRDEPVPRRMD